MKTIEERAKEKCGSYLGQQGYIIGAKEQQAIDFDKAVEWIKNRLGVSVDFTTSNENGTYNLCKYKIIADALIEDFRKHMQSEEPQQTCEDAQLNCDKSNK